MEEFLSKADPSILHFLIASGDDITSKQLRDDLMTLLIAGHETTAAVLTWTFHLIVDRPDVIARMREEVRARCCQGRVSTARARQARARQANFVAAGSCMPRAEPWLLLTASAGCALFVPCTAQCRSLNPSTHPASFPLSFACQAPAAPSDSSPLQCDRVLGGRKPTFEQVRELRYCMRVINESMRMYPQPPVLIRRALADDELGGYRVPAGSDIFISVWNLHRWDTLSPAEIPLPG